MSWGRGQPKSAQPMVEDEGLKRGGREGGKGKQEDGNERGKQVKWKNQRKEDRSGESQEQNCTSEVVKEEECVCAYIYV